MEILAVSILHHKTTMDHSGLQDVMFLSLISNLILIFGNIALIRKQGGENDDANGADTDRLPSYSEASTWRGGLSMFLG